ncbi:MAG: MBL fold metallo-hydrolase [Deltaproteobacteria bacterium]|nr:MBL fold metallo-hydrolase [Deltaproteobacteria bacterium]
MQGWRRAPQWFRPPDLDPRGVTLEPVALGAGVWGLMADRSPVNNCGFIVGEREIMVVDAHLNAVMAGQVLSAVRQVSQLPISYLVLTSDHGDHHFGAHAFPAGTRVVAHDGAGERADFKVELGLLRQQLGAAASELDEVRFRPVDITFARTLAFDLGNQRVELHHFGPGESAGDCVVWVPQAGVAFTGDLIKAEGFPPCLLEQPAERFLESVRRFRQTMAPRVVVPAHGTMGSSAAAELCEQYLRRLLETTQELVESGQHPSESTTAELRRFIPTLDEELAPLLEGVHRLNIERTYSRLLVARG